MSVAYWVTGDTRAVTAHIPDGSIDLILTSPPFLALRSYLPSDDPNKGLEIGSEATPGAFIDVLLDLTVEWRRILAPHGSICVELGDTYSGSGGAGGDYADEGLREGQPKADGSGRRQRAADVAAGILAPQKRPGPAGRDSIQGWPLAKSLTLIPEAYRMALAYGRNPHTGRTIQPWRVRNVVRWVRPNPLVGALGDKYRPATSEMVVACVSGKRYFDLDAVRTALQPGSEKPRSYATGSKTDQENGQARVNNSDGQMSNPAGAPPLDWWNIPTHGFAGAHYATWPPALCVKPILSMCPEKVCTICGEPSRRITSDPTYERTDSDRVPPRLAMRDGERVAEGVNSHTQSNGANTSVTRTVETLGFTDCGHNAWRPGRVLDPFGGSGTTGAVSTGHGRDAIGIDLDHRNAELARDRIGPLFFTETTATELGELLR